MEDCNMLAADCIVICCCSQCLILQMLIFVLLKLPCKLLGKTKRYAKKELIRRRGRIRRRKEDQKMIARSIDEGRRFQLRGGFYDEAVELDTSTSSSSITVGMEIVKGLAVGFGFGFAGASTGGEGRHGHGHGHVLSYHYQCCSSIAIEQAEKVLGELSQRGEFAFGSFWGRSLRTAHIRNT